MSVGGWEDGRMEDDELEEEEDGGEEGRGEGGLNESGWRRRAARKPYVLFQISAHRDPFSMRLRTGSVGGWGPEERDSGGCMTAGRGRDVQDTMLARNALRMWRTLRLCNEGVVVGWGVALGYLCRELSLSLLACRVVSAAARESRKALTPGGQSCGRPIFA